MGVGKGLNGAKRDTQETMKAYQILAGSLIEFHGGITPADNLARRFEVKSEYTLDKIRYITTVRFEKNNIKRGLWAIVCNGCGKRTRSVFALKGGRKCGTCHNLTYRSIQARAGGGDGLHALAVNLATHQRWVSKVTAKLQTLAVGSRKHEKATASLAMWTGRAAVSAQRYAQRVARSTV